MANALSTPKEKLDSLRGQFNALGIDGFLIPRADEYQSEYVAPYADRMRWISGFTGSAGMVVVLKDKAVTMTDGRYLIQVAKEVDPSCFSTADMTVQSAGKWLALNAAPNAVIGYDPKLHTPSQIEAIEKDASVSGITFKALGHNPLDAVWDDQPAAPQNPVALFPDNYAGLSFTDKKAMILDGIKAKGAAGCVITLPDSVCWLLNVRGSDIDFNPVVLSSVIADAQVGTLEWFVDGAKIPADVKAHFGNDLVFSDPAALEGRLGDLGKAAQAAGKDVLLDSQRSSLWFKTVLEQSGASLKHAKDPCVDPKARKTLAEQNAIRAAHIVDGAAMVKFLYWLDQHDEKSGLDEIAVSSKLESFRQQGQGYKGLSFSTISGFAGNGAIIHYHATPTSNAKIDKAGLLLVDSGAQYENGTTDITRTIAIGQPPEEARENFTRVLKGHIALASARFPKGTTGQQLDILARQPLRNANIDFAHGTGHGVGCYLSVHEEAASISSRGKDAVEGGMLLSNEPGYYKESEYGIRIENLILAKEDGFCAVTGALMHRFETVSFAPIDKTLIKVDMLAPEEKDWLNAYHRDVYAKISPALDAAQQAWLKDKTAPIL